MLEKRVEVLENKVDRILESITNVGIAVRELVNDNKEIRKTLNEIQVKMATKDELNEVRKEVGRLKEDTSELKGRMSGIEANLRLVPTV